MKELQFINTYIAYCFRFCMGLYYYIISFDSDSDLVRDPELLPFYYIFLDRDSEGLNNAHKPDN